MKEQNLVRTVLKNEITWVIFIIGTVFGAVRTVILPLQQLQYQISTLQVTVAKLEGYDTRITKNSTDIAILEAKTNK